MELRRFLQFDDGKMFAPGGVADRQVEALAALAPNGSLGPSTWRTPRPLVPGFDARRKASRREIEGGLVRRLWSRMNSAGLKDRCAGTKSQRERVLSRRLVELPGLSDCRAAR